MKLKSIVKAVALASTSAALSVPAFAEEAPSESSTLADAIADGKGSLTLRYRAESVSQDGVDEDALASLLKTRISWKSGSYNGFTLTAEFDDVAAIGEEDYNSTANGNTDYPVVADPIGTDLNQANLSYKADGFKFTAGRQRILHGSQRFVGGVGWRQNEQTFDGYRVEFAATDAVSVDYSYVYNVNRIFGPIGDRADLDGALHLINTAVDLETAGKVTGYAYLLDFEDAAAISTETYGLEYKGKFGPVSTTLSYAQQSDYGDNPTEFTTDYSFVELATPIAGVVTKVGYEQLGADNGKGFSTPLATLHKFQGFTDKFLGTPGTGITDTSLTLVKKFGSLKLVGMYHDFSSTEDSISYGSEVDLVVNYGFSKNYSGMLKVGQYSADELGTDTTKVWLMFTGKF